MTPSQNVTGAPKATLGTQLSLRDATLRRETRAITMSTALSKRARLAVEIAGCSPKSSPAFALAVPAWLNLHISG